MLSEAKHLEFEILRLGLPRLRMTVALFSPHFSDR